MKTAFKFPDDDDWKRNDAIAQILKNIQPSFAAMPGRNSPAWFQYPKTSSILSDMVNRTYEQFNNHRWFENVLPSAVQVSLMTDLYKNLEAAGTFDRLQAQITRKPWVEDTVANLSRSVAIDVSAVGAQQSDWLKNIYPGVDWSKLMDRISQDSSWSGISATIAQTGIALTDTILTDSVIESLFEEAQTNTDLDHTAESELAQFNLEEPDDPLLEFILSRLAQWVQHHQPKLQDRAVELFNRTASVSVYIFITVTMPSILPYILGPVPAIFATALLLGLVRFYEVGEKARLSPPHAKALNFECPYCTAIPNAQCVTIRGSNIGHPTRIHKDRLRTARTKGHR